MRTISALPGAELGLSNLDYLLLPGMDWDATRALRSITAHWLPAWEPGA